MMFTTRNVGLQTLAGQTQKQSGKISANTFADPRFPNDLRPQSYVDGKSSQVLTCG
jgi:hypothetical protein